jgi:hypothetical protein
MKVVLLLMVWTKMRREWPNENECHKCGPLDYFFEEVEKDKITEFKRSGQGNFVLKYLRK